MRKLMEALILAGLAQVAQDVQDVFKGGGGFATERRKVSVESRAGARASGFVGG